MDGLRDQNEDYKIYIQPSMWETLLVLALTTATLAQQTYLNNAPVIFSLQGSTSYVPNTGGIPIPGYKLNVGFDRHSWLGIQFMTQTSGSNFDTLVLQRTSSPSGGVYTCSIRDFYIPAGRPTVLISDRITSLDTIVTSTSNSSAYQLTIPRTIGNTSGQDWQGGNFVEICFFTADTAFNASLLTKQYTACFGYQIDAYFSTYRGYNLGSMMFEGIQSPVYGGVYGPFLQLQLYWFRNSPNVTNTSNIIIQIGKQISEVVGKDYYVCSNSGGDYYGADLLNLQLDLDYSGYSNGACNYRTTSTSIQLAYTRDIYTYDSFDFPITSSLYICLIGSQTGCGTFTLPVLISSMFVKSALQVSEGYTVFFAIFMGVYLLLMN